MKLELGPSVDVHAELDTPPFVGCVLPLVAAALGDPANRPALKLLHELDPHTSGEDVIDRLVVVVHPELLGPLLAHYANGGPALARLKSPKAMQQLDAALAALIPWLTSLAPAIRTEASRTGQRINHVLRAALREVVARSR